MLGESKSFHKHELEKSKDFHKEQQKEFQIPAKWEWLPCNYELKRESNGIETHWSLAPTIQLAGSDPKVSPKVDISISLERAFMHSDELGWNWHKSWNLPNITINIKITDPKTNETILPPADLKAQLLSVKVLSNKAELFKLYDLGLKGSFIQDLSEGQTVFSGIKFSSTSYNNDGFKFHLIVLVYIQEDASSRACPKILYSRISPPIFVDSRKSARDSNIIRNKKIVYKYFDPFLPEAFEKTFIKRNSKQSDSKEEIIENSLEGLSQYFTAPNIRNKVKHPIFLAVKFSKCVKLYFNTNLIKPEAGADSISEEELIQIMQKIFMETHYKNKSKIDANSNLKCFYNKYFILLIEEPNNLDSFQLNKKISDYLEPIQNEVLHVIFNSNITPSNFKEIQQDKLAKAYVKIYTNLLYLKNTYPANAYHFSEDTDDKVKGAHPASKIRNVVSLGGEYQNSNKDSDAESAEDSDPEPPVGKKIKTNDYQDFATARSSSKAGSISPEDKDTSIQIKQEDEMRGHEAAQNGSLHREPSVQLTNGDTMSGASTNTTTTNNIVKPFPTLSHTQSNGSGINPIATLGGGGAFSSAKSSAQPLIGGTFNKVNGEFGASKIIPNNIGIVQNKKTQQQAAPIQQQAAPMQLAQAVSNNNNNSNASNLANLTGLPNNLQSMVNNNNNSSNNNTNSKNMSDAEMNLLWAYQQEQLKNQMLMSYVFQNMGSGNPLAGLGNNAQNPLTISNNQNDNMKQMEILRLLSGGGGGGNMNAPQQQQQQQQQPQLQQQQQQNPMGNNMNGSTMNSMSSDIKTEYKNDLSSLLMNGQNNMMNNQNSNLMQQLQQKNMNFNALSQMLMNRNTMNNQMSLPGLNNFANQMQNPLQKSMGGFNPGNNNSNFTNSFNGQLQPNVNNGANTAAAAHLLLSLNGGNPNGQQQQTQNDLLNNKGIFNNNNVPK